MCRGFEAVLNGLNRRENLDIYVTGSNSKFLSTDVLTEFRGGAEMKSGFIRYVFRNMFLHIQEIHMMRGWIIVPMEDCR